ncbi:hypothetical protein GH714_021213 [Hevea brasiliensis]|uniref:Uncharacterized protein n=1 Tax=Hevea brasiliensis TaxID=3981 RepID=A0A6A6MGF2_HEVBR|nr:hypothetical protein GH714_021213 [Hevea brasiliensis]
MKSMVEDVQKSYVELFRGISDGNLVFQDDSMAQAPFSRKTKCLADLNEPIKLEEEVDPESNDFLGPVLDHSSDMNSFPERICTETLSTSSEDDEIEQAHEISTSYLLNLNSGKLHRERSDFGLESYPEEVATACKHTSSELIPLDDVKNHDSSLVSSWRKHTRDIVRTPIAVQALPCFNSVRLSRSSKFRSPEIHGGKSCSVINLESGPTFCSISAQSSSCDGDNEFASEASNTQKHTRAPASPENKETSPPRGESDENQLDMPCQLPEQENRDLLEDLITVAAEAIVSISSSQIRSCTETVTFKPSEASQNDSLYWFSKIASSVVDDPESEFGVVLSFKNTDNHDEYLSDGIDYFEAMTLKLKETKAEPYFCKTRVLKEEAACPASLPIQPRRGQTRRGRQQRKDFQSEILPSLASLSRYEVTEDLHAIGGLIEAAHQNTGARRTGRNVWMSGRRRRSSISPSQAETSLCHC